MHFSELEDDENDASRSVSRYLSGIGNEANVPSFTSTQEEFFRQTIGNIKFPIIPQVQLPAFAFSESTFKSVVDLSDTWRSFVKPLVDNRSAWAGVFAATGGESLRGFPLPQSMKELIAPQMWEGISSTFSETVFDSLRAIIDEKTNLLATIGEPIVEAYRSPYPSNLRDINGLTLDDIDEVVMDDGIPLYAVPRSSIAEELVRAEDVQERQQILVTRWREISSDCREAVVACESEEIDDSCNFALAALDALDAGNTTAAQTVAGTLLDALLRMWFGSDRSNYMPDGRGVRTKEAYDELSVRQYIAFAPIWQAYQHFFPTQGVPIPETFSRHATAHTVAPQQFCQSNAVQAVMLISSLLVHIDEES